jgi:hypothetical protein
MTNTFGSSVMTASGVGYAVHTLTLIKFWYAQRTLHTTHNYEAARTAF